MASEASQCLGFMAAEQPIEGQNVPHRSPAGDHFGPQMAESVGTEVPSCWRQHQIQTGTLSGVRNPLARKRPPHHAREQAQGSLPSLEG